MHPEQIKAALRMKGISPTALASEMRVANSSVSQVISGRAVSARIRQRIAEITGMPVDRLWPPVNERHAQHSTRPEGADARIARRAP
ncbi:MAG: helix-turn-helix domain-containing protein [Comamonas sp.]|jgi:lambda repressor-like predicted transcriptional regulator|uniref:helix-turn-helix domain-containing protein n=1 Tax=Comamonas sp. TaxID=34028 RepID=UPI0012C54098|nr:helix-turn-helix domain-containing protein [Comamonas sp.]MDR3064773.1 helix-turn-helix domain-containing protein [Comamonas sp.]MPS95248.1 transcriptional regulator [Comamonas sp.]